MKRQTKTSIPACESEISKQLVHLRSLIRDLLLFYRLEGVIEDNGPGKTMRRQFIIWIENKVSLKKTATDCTTQLAFYINLQRAVIGPSG